MKNNIKNSFTGYIGLGSNEKPFESLYVNEIHLSDDTVVPLSTLKSVVAESSDFADFQSRIAAL